MKKEDENSAAANARKRALIRSLIERTRAAEEEDEEHLPFADNVELVFTEPVPVLQIQVVSEEQTLAEVIPFPRSGRS